MKSQELDGRVFTIGRIVHYVDSKDKQWPFLITACYTEKGVHMADGALFANEIEMRVLVPYDKKKNNGTWHFPTMGLRKRGPRPGKPLRVLTPSGK